MVTGQGECVLKTRWCPGACRVTLCTVLGETETGMVLSALIISAVAGVAARSKSGEDAAGMTLRTIQTAMPSCQDKAGVIKRTRRPGAGTVAILTTLGEAQGSVVRGRLIVAAVAGVAIRGQSGEDTAGMTLRTIQTAMPTCQGKA